MVNALLKEHWGRPRPHEIAPFGGDRAAAVVGELDIPEMREGAARLAADIPGASAATVAGASHLPSLERPEEFDALVLEFLGGLPD